MPFKWKRWVAVVLCLILLLLGAILSDSLRLRGQPSPEEPTGRPWRIIGVWDGRIALYLPQTDMPVFVYDMSVTALSESEQKKLREGIAVFDSNTLAKQLENYLCQ